VLDASECPPTFNSPPGQVVGVIAGGPAALTTAVEGAEDHPEFAERDLKAIGFSAKDVVVGIATSGRTPYVLGALRYGRSLGAFAIGLACVPDAAMVAEVNLMITPAVGPEVLTGSTRLKAGTATKLVLNTLTTGAMVRLGKSYGNLMVDLRASNLKLKARTNRILRQLLEIDAEDADLLLAQCAGELKTAIVVGGSGLTPDDARERLAQAGGRVADVLDQSTPYPSYPHLILGVDGGGTHTHAFLANRSDAAAIKGRGGAGPSNMKAGGASAAFAAINRAVDAAFADMGLPRGRVAAACLGLAGAGRPDDQAAVRKWAEQVRLADAVQVVGDFVLPIAMLPEGWGIVVIAGTGSSVWGRANDGQTARAGGWGPILGDEGSAYWLVISAIRQVARWFDRRARSTALTERLLARMKLDNPSQFVGAIQGGEWDRARLAELADDVIRAADEGDSIAQEIVEAQVADLAECVRAVATTLRLDPSVLPLALAGGLLTRAPTYRDRLLMRLGQVGVRPAHVMEVSEPCEGALRLAATMEIANPKS
jgi:N-acetylmuramic acid 6-phosphate etherase